MATTTTFTSRRLDRKNDIAHKLSEATNNRFNIGFCKDYLYDNDPDALGHLYIGNINDELYGDRLEQITLDDREPDLLGQLENELARIVDHFSSALKAVKKYRAEHQGKLPRGLAK
jgi:hypothetical protein